MSLKLRLKPHEKVLIGHAVVQNGDKSSLLFIENNVPILREKDIMQEQAAVTLEQRIYFLIQLMYVDRDDLARYLALYSQHVEQLLAARPELAGELDPLTALVQGQDYYHALKAARSIMQGSETPL